MPMSNQGQATGRFPPLQNSDVHQDYQPPAAAQPQAAPAQHKHGAPVNGGFTTGGIAALKAAKGSFLQF